MLTQAGFAALRLVQLLTGILRSGEGDGAPAPLPDADDVLPPLMLASAGLASLTAGRDASVSAPLIQPQTVPCGADNSALAVKPQPQLHRDFARRPAMPLPGTGGERDIHVCASYDDKYGVAA